MASPGTETSGTSSTPLKQGEIAEKPTYAYRSVGPRCSQAMDSLSQCRRKHGSKGAVAEAACKQLEAAATWCALGATCPEQARDLQSCAEANTPRGRPNPLKPPKECRGKADDLERCIEMRSETQAMARSMERGSS